ncbi:MAG TPA: glycosyltransferase family 2 protein [Candidatus Paceibacterota bacterium]|nr:glycosyltransferase family 2 protein [Candidatus Paceibacterota bacterium]
MKPLISVIIPAHNSATTIGTAIRSIASQTWRELEIIVIDDNSADDTRSVVLALAKEDPRISYYALPFNDPNRVNSRGRNINAGYSARNYGFEKARGAYITFQDADDASFANRIEAQYDLLIKHDSMHVTFDWQSFDEKYLGKRFDIDAYLKDRPGMMGPDELARLARRTKGVAYKILGSLAAYIPWSIKTARILNKAFFGALDPYPASGNSSLFKREVIDKVRFRKLADRVWPSFMGRGADRDFNFEVAETFGRSHVFFAPMYMWRQTKQNERYDNMPEKYIIG